MMKEISCKLNLSEEVLKTFLGKAIAKGLSFEELLETFVNDLSGGDRSSGSDERELAQEYYDRLTFENDFAGNSFVKFFLDNFFFDVSNFVEMKNDFEMVKDDFEDYGPEFFNDPDDYFEIKTLSEFYKNFYELSEFEDYYENVIGAKNFEEVTQEFLAFYKKYEKFFDIFIES